MSQESEDLLRRAVDAWNRKEIDDGLLALLDADAEYVNAPSAVEPGTRRGRSEVVAVMQAQWAALTDAHWEIDRVYEQDDQVIALGRMSRRMPGSDARLEDRTLVSWKFRRGKVVRIEALGFGRTEVETALERLGLQE